MFPRLFGHEGKKETDHWEPNYFMVSHWGNRFNVPFLRDAASANSEQSNKHRQLLPEEPRDARTSKMPKVDVAFLRR